MSIGQSTNGNPQNAYKQVAVDTASPEKLLVMLYTGIMKFLRLAEKALEEKKMDEANENLTKVQNIIIELYSTLDVEKGGEIAVNLQDLYLFYYGETIKANLSKDVAYLKPVIKFFEIFRDVWIDAAKIARMGAK